MTQRNIIERAFQLAESGVANNLTQLATKLGDEGFEAVHSHLHGPGIRKQLILIIKDNFPVNEK